MRPKELILAIKRTQYTPSFDKEDSQTYGSEYSPEVPRPFGDRSLSEINKEFNTVAGMLLKLYQQENNIKNLRQQGEYIVMLQALLRLKEKQKEPQISNLKAPPQVHIASSPPPSPVEDPKDFDINFNEHSSDRSAQGQASTLPSNNTSTTSIEGEDPKDLGDKKITNTRQGRVSNPSSTPVAAHCTAIPKGQRPPSRSIYHPILQITSYPAAKLRDRSCPNPLSEHIIIDNLPDPRGE
jgi:hypothetical protein